MIIFIPIVSFAALPLYLFISLLNTPYQSSFLPSNSYFHSIPLNAQYFLKLYIASSSLVFSSPSRLFMDFKRGEVSPATTQRDVNFD